MKQMDFMNKYERAGFRQGWMIDGAIIDVAARLALLSIPSASRRIFVDAAKKILYNELANKFGLEELNPDAAEKKIIEDSLYGDENEGRD